MDRLELSGKRTTAWCGNKNHWIPCQSRDQTATPANVCRRDQGSADHNGKEEELTLHSLTNASRTGWPGARFRRCRNRCRDRCRNRGRSRCRKRLARPDQRMAHPLVSAEGGVGGTGRHEPRSSTSVLVRMYYTVNQGALGNNHGINRPPAGAARERGHHQPLEPDRSAAGQD